MSSTIEFKVPTKSGKLATAKGEIAWLKVGNRRVKFVIQQDEYRYLTHYASGCIFGSLDAMLLELVTRFSLNHKFNDRQLAKRIIDKAIKRNGLDYVLSKIDKAPVIND